MMPSVTPEILRPPVWPLPRSLATTSGISVDVFSSPYLDVSVQAVPLLQLFDSLQDTLRWVSPFGNSGIKAYVQLPQTYRSLSRPSSALDAKAFPLRSYQLDLVEVHSAKPAFTQAQMLSCFVTSPLKIKAIRFDFVFGERLFQIASLSSTNREKSNIGSLISRIMQTH